MIRIASRWLAGALVAVLALAVAVRPASAHALRQTSYPDAGATLPRAPTEVRVTFGEQPDPKLSSLRVLDAAGRDHTSGKTEAVGGQPLTLRVAVQSLPNGVYTVAWRTVSRVDGHLASGTFAFGVGVSPSAAASSAGAARAPSPSTRNIAGRWLLYVGLMILLGASATVVAATGVASRWVFLLLGVGVVAGAAGAFGIALDQLHTAGLGASKLFDSPFGHATIVRAVPIAAAAIALIVAMVLSGARRLAVIAAVGVAAAVGMWGDVEASHASAAKSLRLGRMALQWVHFAAAGVWVGGLLAILVAVPAMSAERRLVAVRRYSGAALIAVAVIAITGVLRAYDEVHSLHPLLHTTFGRYVVLKSALLVVLIGLGALNRYRSVPLVARTLRPLRAVGRTELALVAVVLVAAGMLQGLAPPASASRAKPLPPVVISGHDFGTTIRVRLTVSPGTAGFDAFRLLVTDYDSGRPVDVDSARLRFVLPARPDLGQSTLALDRAAPGTYTARGANLSIDGTWSVTVVVQRSNGGVEVPLTVATRQPRQRIDVQRNKGLPTVYTLHLSDDRALQVYVDPGRSGTHVNEFHATFVGPDGNEIAVDDVTVTSTAPGQQTALPLTTRRLDPLGHFVSDLLDATSGSYRFDVHATLKTGEQVDGHFTIPIT